MTTSKKAFTPKELKSLKKEDLIRLLVDSKNSTSSPICHKASGSANNTPMFFRNSDSGLASSDTLPDGILAQVKAAVIDAVHDLKNELRLEYQALLRDLEQKFSHQIESLRSETLALQNKIDSQFKNFETEILRDIQDTEQRKDNLIIFGLKESEASSFSECKEADTNAIQSLSSELGVPDLQISRFYRLGRRGSKPRPVKMTCTQPEQRFELLKAAPRIPRLDPDLGFRRIFIKPDLSPKAQEVDRQLRKELKFRREVGERVVIRGGRVIPDPKHQPHNVD